MDQRYANRIALSRRGFELELSDPGLVDLEARLPTQVTRSSNCLQPDGHCLPMPSLWFRHGLRVSGSGARTGSVRDGVAQLVAADYQAGRSTTWLRRTYGLRQGAVLRLLDANGVLRRRQGSTTEQVEEAIRFYDEGWSLTRIGDHPRRDHTVVRNALHGAGVGQPKQARSDRCP